jgi:hypothetical protein
VKYHLKACLPVVFIHLYIQELCKRRAFKQFFVGDSPLAWHLAGFRTRYCFKGIKLIKGKVLPVHAMKVYLESRGLAPLILNLDFRWR